MYVQIALEFWLFNGLSMSVGIDQSDNFEKLNWKLTLIEDNLKLPDMLGSWVDMQDAMDCEMFVQSIEPGSKKTANKAHSNEDQNIL